MQRSFIFSSESLPELGLDRKRIPGGLLFAIFLLALVEFGLARREIIWSWVPHSDPGVVDVLEDKVLYANEKGEGPRVVFFGNSRTRDGVAPRTFEKRLRLPEGAVVNLALTRGTAFDAEVLYRRNRELLRSAHVVFFGVDVLQLDGALPLNERVRRFATLGERLSRFDGSDRIELVVGWLWRSYDARDALRRFVKTSWKDRPSGLPITEDGRVAWRTDKINRRASRTRMKVFARHHFRKYKRDENRRRQLRDFVRLLESDGIEVVIMQVPVRSDYASQVRRRYPTHLMDYEDDLRRSVGDRTFLIWWDSEFVGLSKRHFYDYGHLNDAGTSIFTKRLADWLRKRSGPALRKPRERSPVGPTVPVVIAPAVVPALGVVPPAGDARDKGPIRVLPEVVAAPSQFEARLQARAGESEESGG